MFDHFVGGETSAEIVSRGLSRVLVTPPLIMLVLPYMFSIQEQLLSRNVERFRGGLVFKAHKFSYHSTLGSRVIKKKRREGLGFGDWVWGFEFMVWGLGLQVWC